MRLVMVVPITASTVTCVGGAGTAEWNRCEAPQYCLHNWSGQLYAGGTIFIRKVP